MRTFVSSSVGQWWGVGGREQGRGARAKGEGPSTGTVHNAVTFAQLAWPPMPSKPHKAGHCTGGKESDRM